MSKAEMSRRTFFKVALTGTAAVVLNSACNTVFGATPVGAAGRTPENTLTPIPPDTPYPTEVPPPTTTPEPSATPASTETPTPEALDWNFVSKSSDEEIFNKIGIPNPEDYSLSEELSPNKILRNPEGRSYALFKNNDGIDLLAENLESRQVEHAIYAEHPRGVPLLLLTDPGVVEKDNGWFQLNKDYPETDARDRLGEAFNRGLAMRWWGNNHPQDDIRSYLYSFAEIPGFWVTPTDPLTRGQRRQISDYMLDSFIDARENAIENNPPLVVGLPDRNRAQFNADKGTLIIKTVLTGDGNWLTVIDEVGSTKYLHNVASETSGSFVTVFLRYPHFMPSRNNLNPVGGTITGFFRYFFGIDYFYRDQAGNQPDMTGPIFENLCKTDSVPKSLLNLPAYSRTYPTFDWLDIAQPTNDCAVN